MSGLSELIAKLEGLSGPDREVDIDLGIALGAFVEDPDAASYGPYLRRRLARRAPALTRSLDAAVALVERKLPGTFYHVAKGRLTASEPLYGAQLLFGSEEVLGEGAHRVNLALALCLALLRSLEGRDE